MVFSPNPLALSVPEPAFESWLRDTGYLEVVDQRTSDLHRLCSSTSATATDSAAATNTPSTDTINNGIFLSLFSNIGTLLSLLTLNPFSKLTIDDFSGETPSWTIGFIGLCDSYTFPSSPAQTRLRVHENVKRYGRNYASLFVIFFACSLYQIPLALVGLISSLALWDVFRYYGDHWGVDQYPLLRQIFVRIVQCSTAVILFYSNVQMALFCAVAVSYVGDVAGVDGQLAVARAFGDKSLKEHLSSEPDVSVESIGDDTKFVILASDGIWKVLSNQEAVDCIKNIKDARLAAKHLTEEALARKSTDDISCVVVKFQ